MISITVTDAARGFADLINRVRYRGESATLVKGGKPVAKVVPVSKVCTGAELAAAWPGIRHLDASEATAMKKDMDTARRKLPPVKSKWD